MLFSSDYLNTWCLSLLRFLKQWVFLNFRTLFLHDQSMFLSFVWDIVVLLDEIYTFVFYSIHFYALWEELFGLEVNMLESCLGFMFAWSEVEDERWQAVIGWV